jgi:hypothetical protein
MLLIRSFRMMFRNTIQTPVAKYSMAILTSEHLPVNLPDLHDVIQHANETLDAMMLRPDMHPVVSMQTNEWPSQTELAWRIDTWQTRR